MDGREKKGERRGREQEKRQRESPHWLSDGGRQRMREETQRRSEQLEEKAQRESEAAIGGQSERRGEGRSGSVCVFCNRVFCFCV